MEGPNGKDRLAFQTMKMGPKTMIGAALIFALGLLVLGTIPLPDWMAAILFSDFWGDWGDALHHYGIAAAFEDARPWLGTALIVGALWSQRRALLWPLRHAYWLRRIFGGRIFGGARWARRRDLHKQGMTDEGGLFLGGLRGRDFFHNGEGHLLTIGGVGGGKSSGLVVPTLISLTQGSVIVTDPSGELAAMTARRRAEIGPVVFLNPFGDIFAADTGLHFDDAGFNPFSVLDPKASSFITDVNALARLLMVGDRKESGSYWNDEGAEFLSLMIASILLYDHKDLHNLTFLYQVVRDSSDNVAQRLEWIMSENHPALRDDAQRFFDIIENAKPQWAGIVSKAALATKRYAPTTPLGVHVGKDGFDAARLKTENVTVYLLVPSSMLAVALPWLNMLMGVFGAAIGKPGPRAPVTMLIDEAPALGYLPDLRGHMAQFRKVGLRVWLFTQTYAAMAGQELYGDTGMKEIMGLVTIKQFFAVEEPEVQKMVSDLCGMRSVSNPSSTGSTGDVGQPLIRPDEVRGLQKWHQVIIRGGLHFPIKAKLVPYFNRPKWRPMVDENPYRK